MTAFLRQCAASNSAFGIVRAIRRIAKRGANAPHSVAKSIRRLSIQSRHRIIYTAILMKLPYLITNKKIRGDSKIAPSDCRKTPICKQVGVKIMPNYAFAQKSRSITVKNEKNMRFLQLWIAYFLRFIAANLSLTQFVT